MRRFYVYIRLITEEIVDEVRFEKEQGTMKRAAEHTNLRDQHRSLEQLCQFFKYNLYILNELRIKMSLCLSWIIYTVRAWLLLPILDSLKIYWLNLENWIRRLYHPVRIAVGHGIRLINKELLDEVRLGNEQKYIESRGMERIEVREYCRSQLQRCQFFIFNKFTPGPSLNSIVTPDFSFVSFIQIILLSLILSCCHNTKLMTGITDQTRSNLNAVEVICNNQSIVTSNFLNYFNKLLNVNTAGDYKWRLEVEFNITDSPLALQQDSEILRENIQQIVVYKLYSLPAMKMVHSASFRQINSYNTLFSSYSTYIEEERVRINLALRAAEDLRNRLIIYFNKYNRFEAY